jgi:hypothetical protein
MRDYHPQFVTRGSNQRVIESSESEEDERNEDDGNEGAEVELEDEFAFEEDEPVMISPSKF